MYRFDQEEIEALAVEMWNDEVKHNPPGLILVSTIHLAQRQTPELERFAAWWDAVAAYEQMAVLYGGDLTALAALGVKS